MENLNPCLEIGADSDPEIDPDPDPDLDYLGLWDYLDFSHFRYPHLPSLQDLKSK